MTTSLAVSSLTLEEAKQIAKWKYSGPWNIYSDSEVEDELECYYSVRFVDGPMIGFYCVNEAARVPGLVEDPKILDLGVGMHPDYVAKGLVLHFANAIREHAQSLFSQTKYRAVVQSWHLRSLGVAKHLGFIQSDTITLNQGGKDVEYTVLLTP